MNVTCKLCKEEGRDLEAVLNYAIVGENLRSKANGTGAMMKNHVEKYHKSFLLKLVGLGRVFNGFVLMNKFEIPESEVELLEELENTRDELVDIVMEDGPPDENMQKLEDILHIILGDDEDEEVITGDELPEDIPDNPPTEISIVENTIGDTKEDELISESD